MTTRTALADQILDGSNTRYQTGHLLSQLASHSMYVDVRRTGAILCVNATIPAFAPLVSTSHHSKSIVLAVSQLLLPRWRHVERGYCNLALSLPNPESSPELQYLDIISCPFRVSTQPFQTPENASLEGDGLHDRSRALWNATTYTSDN